MESGRQAGTPTEVHPIDLLNPGVYLKESFGAARPASGADALHAASRPRGRRRVVRAQLGRLQHCSVPSPAAMSPSRDNRALWGAVGVSLALNCVCLLLVATSWQQGSAPGATPDHWNAAHGRRLLQVSPKRRCKSERLAARPLAFERPCSAAACAGSYGVGGESPLRPASRAHAGVPPAPVDRRHDRRLPPCLPHMQQHDAGLCLTACVCLPALAHAQGAGDATSGSKPAGSAMAGTGPGAGQGGGARPATSAPMPGPATVPISQVAENAGYAPGTGQAFDPLSYMCARSAGAAARAYALLAQAAGGEQPAAPAARGAPPHASRTVAPLHPMPLPLTPAGG